MQTNKSAGSVPEVGILYQDSNVLVINKPAGIAVHPKNAYDQNITIQGIFASQLSGGDDPLRFGIVHRLDKDTSGVMIMAKNETALKFLQAQFAARTVMKLYSALVWGHLQHPQARIELPIRRSTKAPNIMAIHTAGKPAVSEYKVIANYDKYSLLEVKLHTGRTHQIRIQFAHLGHSVVGDSLYSHKPIPEGLKRQFLHAQKLGIILPSNEKSSLFEASLPADLSSFMDSLNNE